MNRCYKNKKTLDGLVDLLAENEHVSHVGPFTAVITSVIINNPRERTGSHWIWGRGKGKEDKVPLSPQFIYTGCPQACESVNTL